MTTKTEINVSTLIAVFKLVCTLSMVLMRLLKNAGYGERELGRFNVQAAEDMLGCKFGDDVNPLDDGGEAAGV